MNDRNSYETKFFTKASIALFVLMSLTALTSWAVEPLSSGGSNYLTVNLDVGRLRSVHEAWRDSSIFISPICQYREQIKGIKRDLAALRANGQRRLALVLWHARLDPPLDCSGYLLNSKGGKLSGKVMFGLAALIDTVSAQGFDEIHLRFAPMWVNDPKLWPDWMESLYQENLGVVRQVYQLVKTKQSRVILDLGLELGGLSENGPLKSYVTKLWGEFCASGDDRISFANSIAAEPGRVARYLSWLAASPCPAPNPLYLDVYTDAKSRLQRAATEARQSGIASPKFVIEETYYSDESEFDELRTASRSSNVDLLYIMQWPITRADANFIVANTPRYIYTPR